MADRMKGINTTITIRATAQCLVCGRTLEKTLMLAPETVHASLTDRVILDISDAVGAVQAEMAKRGWREQERAGATLPGEFICGRCRDPECDTGGRGR